MEKSQIVVGEEYAVREKTRSADAPLQHVRILQHARARKWKAEWVDPNPGLVDYVESKDVLVRWKDRKSLLRDEQAEREFRAHNERQGCRDPDSPLENALSSVFDTTGESGFTYFRGDLSGPPEALARLRKRAGLEAAGELAPFAYVDRHGAVHVPFDAALELARAFCAAEPATILTDVEATERQWSLEASRSGGEHMVSLLTKYRAAWALIRQWAGHDPAIAEREAHIERLERLVWDAVYALQKAGLDAEAHKLRAQLERRRRP